jgi:predicted secreted protein
MANEAKVGADVMFFAKIGTVPAWVVVGCGKTTGWSGTTDMIDTTTSCSGRDKTQIAGFRSSSFKFDGLAIKEDATPSIASFKTLSALWLAGTTFPVKLVGVDDPTDVIRAVAANITSLDKNASTGEAVSFSVSIAVSGPVAFTPEVA